MSFPRKRRPRTFPSLLLLGRPRFWLAGLGLVLALGGWYALLPAPRRVEVVRLLENYVERDKHISWLDILSDFYQLTVRDDYVPGAPGSEAAASERAWVYAGPPQVTSFPQAVRVLRNRGYWVGYCEAWETPVWAAYRVHDLDKLRPPPPRPEKFEVDRRTAARVAPEDFAGSGYDRGHLAPNYAIATRYGREAQRETFLMSNIAPQRHALNSGPWRELEQRIATNFAGRFDTVWVLAGPVFGASPTPGQNPARLPRGAAIPEAFFMIVLDESDGALRVLAVLMPQDAPEDSPPRRYLVSVREIERRTGLNFFPELPADVATALEERPTRWW